METLKKKARFILYVRLEIGCREPKRGNPASCSKRSSITGYTVRIGEIMETKICCLCKQELDKNLFGKRKEATDGLKSECKKCSNARSKAWAKAHPDKSKAAYKKWKIANPEKPKASSKARYDADPKKEKARNKAWAKANPEAVRAKIQTRRARKACVETTFTPEQWEYCKDYFDCRCAYCGTGDKALHQDHLIALSKGGSYTQFNILPACGSCNSSKGAKDFFVWYPTFKYYSKVREEKILEFLHYIGTVQQLTLCS